jgi:hypothetical protein
MPEDQEPSREAAEWSSSPTSSPDVPAAPPYEPDQGLISYIEKGQKPPSPPDDQPSEGQSQK